MKFHVNKSLGFKYMIKKCIQKRQTSISSTYLIHKYMKGTNYVFTFKYIKITK